MLQCRPESRLRTSNITLPTVLTSEELAYGCRYYSLPDNSPFKAFSQNAFVTQTNLTAAYIKKGGLPLAIGEWSLAGTPACMVRDCT